MEEITYDEIRRIQTKEKGPLLAQIPENFYDLVGALTEKYRKETPNGREYENLIRIVGEIFSRRAEKITTAALNSLKGVEPPPEMLPRERALYDRIVRELRESENSFKQVLAGTLPKPKKLRILKDISAFVGLDGKNYGPFKTGEEVDIPDEESTALISMGVAAKE